MKAITQLANWVSAPYTVYLVLTDREVSRRPKIIAVVVFVALFAYLVSPVDIVPDVVPFSGWLDDILVSAAVMYGASRALPQVQLKEKNRTAEKKVQRVLFILIGAFIFAVTLALSLLAALIVLIVKLAGG
jgi:uncharacterized membrane protein YkvA (DUF1232 family)